MKLFDWFLTLSGLWKRLVIFSGLAILLAGTAVIFGQAAVPPFTWIVLLFLCAATAWLIGDRIEVKQEVGQLRAGMGNLKQQLSENQSWLDVLIRLNQGVLDAQDETELMDTALKYILELSGARAVTFVPVDEWGQPIDSYAYGDYPHALLKRWAEHLASPSVRTRCGNCKKLFAPEESPCPLHELPFPTNLQIYCFNFRHGDRLLGVLGLHMLPKAKLPVGLRTIIEALLNQMGMAIHSIRLRNQEVTTLRQLQMVRTPKMDLQSMVSGLLNSLHHSLDIHFAELRLLPSGRNLPEWEDTIVREGEVPLVDPAELDQLTKQAIDRQAKVIELIEGAEKGVWFTAAMPLQPPEGGVVGVLIVSRQGSAEFEARELAALQNAAVQAAMLVENERLFLSLEYNAVMGERVRLAREIHDGLAQTLAYLKLQVNQMQSYLLQGKLDRLDQALLQNYKALSEAYQDIRHSIDNLRITPDEGLEGWLEQIVEGFEEGSGIRVDRKVLQPTRDLSLEIQAQLIRIVQEALTNIRKHASAKRVWIGLREWNGDVIIEVGDDGQGFSPEDVPELSQHGLRGMRERAEFIGADFQIISQPNQGTLVRIRLPNYEVTQV